jgi:tetratricopeptide (TPR) repeat protein
MGIIGGVLFLVIWATAVWFFLKHSDKNDKTPFYGMGVVLLVILFHGLVDTPLHTIPISFVAYCILGFLPIPALCIHRIYLKSKLLVFFALLILLLYSGSVVFSSINQYRGHVHWQRGYEYGVQHQWSLAIQEYQDALQWLPEKGELFFHVGAALVLNASYSNGIYYLNESRKWYNDRNIYLSLSYAYLRIRNLKEAEHYAKIALSMFPDHLAPHLLLGQIFHEQNLFEKSKKSLLLCIDRRTSIQSDEVNQISADAAELWNKYYPDEIHVPKIIH